MIDHILPLPEGFTLLPRTEERLQELWKKLEPLHGIFSDDNLHNLRTFSQYFLDFNTIILAHEQGVVILRDLIRGLKGEVHLAFWDNKLSPRTDVLKECLIWAFLTYDLYRIGTFVPDYARAVKRFIENKMHFRKEGTLRSWGWHKGRLVDVGIYSILREEVLN